MGMILESTPEMGEYNVEVRSESFYISGEDHTFAKADLPCPGAGCDVVGEHRHSGGIEYRKVEHSIFVYGDRSGQGTAEILIADIPKIRAALDEIEAYVARR